MDASIHVDGVEIKDPSPWLAEARALAAASPCRVRWVSFRMASEPKQDKSRGLHYHSCNGEVEVKYFDDTGKQVDVPMITIAETRLLEEITLCAALNLAAVNSIEFVVDSKDDAERAQRATTLRRVLLTPQS